jgi:hypothetical protein
VADFGDGWNPFPAPAALAATAKTTVLETTADLARLLDDLWQRVDAAGRERAEIDVSFMTHEGGSPGTASFNPQAHLDGLAALADIGVTGGVRGARHRDARAVRQRGHRPLQLSGAAPAPSPTQVAELDASYAAYVGLGGPGP